MKDNKLLDYLVNEQFYKKQKEEEQKQQIIDLIALSEMKARGVVEEKLPDLLSDIASIGLEYEFHSSLPTRTIETAKRINQVRLSISDCLLEPMAEVCTFMVDINERTVAYLFKGIADMDLSDAYDALFNSLSKVRHMVFQKIQKASEKEVA